MKCNHVAARSMEIFRRLGVVSGGARRRPAGGLPERHRLPDDDDRPRAGAHPDPVPPRPLYRDRMARTPSGRRPSRRTASTRSSSSRSCSSMPAATPALTILNRTEFEALTQDADGIVATARDLDSGRGADDRGALPRRLRRRPLAGAPSRSARRFAGDAGRPARAVELYPRAGAARAHAATSRPGQRSRSTRAAAAPSTPSTAARRGWSTTTCATTRRTSTRSTATGRIRAILGVGAGLRVRGHHQRGLVRPPAGGRPLPRPARLHLRRRGAPLGAVRRLRHERRHRRRRRTSAWLLAARLNGWGADGILDAYERERLPITEQVSLLRDGPRRTPWPSSAAPCRPRSRTTRRRARRPARRSAGRLRPQRAAVLLPPG